MRWVCPRCNSGFLPRPARVAAGGCEPVQNPVVPPRPTLLGSVGAFNAPERSVLTGAGEGALVLPQGT